MVDPGIPSHVISEIEAAEQQLRIERMDECIKALAFAQSIAGANTLILSRQPNGDVVIRQLFGADGQSAAPYATFARLTGELTKIEPR